MTNLRGFFVAGCAETRGLCANDEGFLVAGEWLAGSRGLVIWDVGFLLSRCWVFAGLGEVCFFLSIGIGKAAILTN